MKHWPELNELESAIIRVGEFKNLFKLLVAGSENGVNIQVLQSAIYTMEGMIDDIDSTLYEKFKNVFDAVRNEGKDTEPNDEFEEDHDGYNFEDEREDYNFSTSNDYYGSQKYNVNAYSTIAVPQSEPRDGTVQMNSISEEEEAFRNLESALKTWHKPAV